jgi:hypothetical protein
MGLPRPPGSPITLPATGWLAMHPRIQLNFTPTSASWLDLVEVFFS